MSESTDSLAAMPRTTRTAEPKGAPYTWVHYFDSTHADHIEIEAWLASLTPLVRQQREEDIAALLDLAGAGGINSDDQRVIEPVTSFPELWEVKWHFPGRRELRQYHAEPAARAELLVSVHRHLKKVDGTKREQKDAQNHAMAQGKLRHMAGATTEWGTRP